MEARASIAGVREQLTRIIASEELARSPRLIRFLTYVVEETLAGRHETIKEYTIGLRVFDKREVFDPKTDSTVRSEAVQLRARLSRYYDTTGRDDPIVISVPKGSYVAQFRYRQDPAPGNDPVVAVASPRGRRRTLIGLALLSAGAVAQLGWAIRHQPRPDTSHYRFTPFSATPATEIMPVWSPDGRSIAYIATEGGISRIMVKRVDRGTPAVALTEASSESTLAWSPNGERLYYDNLPANPTRIMYVGAAGGKPKVLFESEPAAARNVTRYEAPAVSPDGKTLALLAIEQGGKLPTRRLVLSSPPGAAPKAIGEPVPCCISPASVQWLPDGSHLLIGASGEHGSNVLLVRATGRTEWVIDLPTFENHPSFSPIPRSRYAVLSSAFDYGGDQGLRLLDTTSGSISSLLPSPSLLSSPSVSPDGSRLAYVETHRRFELLEVPLSGDPARPLLPSNLDQHSIAFSPKRNEFVFIRLKQLMIHDRDRDEDRVLVSGDDFPKAVSPPWLGWPEYSPDGQRVVFTCRGCEREMSLWVVPVNGGTPVRVAGGGT